MTTVSVFGGTGFLGRRLVRRLATEGATVRVAVRHPERARESAAAGVARFVLVSGPAGFPRAQHSTESGGGGRADLYRPVPRAGAGLTVPARAVHGMEAANAAESDGQHQAPER